MSEASGAQDDLLGVAEVAGYLGVGEVTIYRWCREERLPCLKIGKSWRIRREALEDFLRRSERSQTLVGQLRSFLEVPDNVLGIVKIASCCTTSTPPSSGWRRRRAGC